MKNLNKLKTILDLAREFESKKTDTELEEGVKKTTKLLIDKKPDTTFEEIIISLLASALESYKHMIKSEDLESTVDMFMELVDMTIKEDGEDVEENELVMLRYFLKSQMVYTMIQKSFNVSVKAVTDLWSGMHGTES